LNAAIEEFPGTLFAETVKIWAKNALGARSEESYEFTLPNSQVYRDERNSSRVPSMSSMLKYCQFFYASGTITGFPKKLARSAQLKAEN